MKFEESCLARRREQSEQPITAETVIRGGDLIDVNGDTGLVVIHVGDDLIRLMQENGDSFTMEHPELYVASARFSHFE